MEIVAHLAIFNVYGSVLMVVSRNGIKQRLERLRWLRGEEIKEKKKKLKERKRNPTNVSDSLSVSHPQKLLVGDFPHELEVDELEEDVPKRKNRTKARVGRQWLFIIQYFFLFFLY